MRLYAHVNGHLRSTLRSLAARLEGGEMCSLTLRRIFAEYHGVQVGLYTHGGCFRLCSMPPGTVIGRYCSIAVTAAAFNANHPMNLRSSHGLFFNPQLGLAAAPLIPRHTLEIGHDVWIGHNAIILPSVRRIETGAVIGAGAVLNRDVPPYAVLTGHPARIVRYRFSPPVIAELLASRWWQQPLERLLPQFADFQRPLEADSVR
ncbi:MAG: CatB-related O-acetyltransferase [Planctomycetota bacterium]